MVSIEQWAASWSREPWVVVPALPAVPKDRGDSPEGWVIVLKKAERDHLSPHLGPLFPDEEVARHIVRCHNRWIKDIRNVRDGREMYDDAEPEDYRALES